MNEDLKKRLIEKSKPVEFKKTQGLLAATTLGVGSLMGAGLYVLVGIAAAEAGPSLWIAYGVCGLLTFLSVTMYSDLSKRLSISGGGYVYAYNQLGSFWGFMVGWHLAMGSIFACALYARGFSAYAAAFLPIDQAPFWLTTLMAIFLVFILVALGLRGGKRGDRVQRFFTWGNLVVLAILAVSAVHKTDMSNFTPMMPSGFKGIGAAISLIYISFFGYQLIANSSEEIRDAKRTVPRAMKLSWFIALVFYIAVALISVAAVNWKELAQSDAPLVLVATRGLGSWGVVLVGLGGILASVAALNGTLLSQGRQIYAMGRDKLLPDLLGTVKGKARVPAAALVAGALATSVVLVFADLTFIAKAANFSLLFSMLPISMALHRLYQKKASDGAPETTIRRAVPFAALAANATLMLTLDQQSLLFGGTIIAAACLVFFTYSYSSEKRGQAGFSVALTNESSPFDILKRGERILVPVANPETQKSLFSISQALLPHGGGEIIILSVVVSDNPRQALQHSTGAFRAVDLIGRVREVANRRGVTIRSVVRAAKSLPDGIAHAATEERADLLVMGWSTGKDATPSELLRDVISKTNTDAIFLQLTEDVLPKRIGVALGGTGNLSLMARIAGTLAEQYSGEVIYLNVVPEYFEREHIEHARKVQVEAIQRHSNLVRYHTELLRSDNPLEALVERSKELDLLVVGSAYVTLLDRNVIGSFTSMVAEQAHCTVVIARQTPPLSKKIRPPVK
ncbi:MAG: amino acid permease [Deltaproteobacteria bacterium]|nr:amino acid permease [Deltaproteobacteria bacterium]